MTARTKLWLILGFLVSLELAVLGAKQILACLFDPVIRSLGS